MQIKGFRPWLNGGLIHSFCGSELRFQEENYITTKAKQKGIYFKVSDKERELIEQKMALAGIRNMSGYIRKMCIDGYTVNLQIPELTECAKLLRFTSINVNQIARRVNSGGGVYPDEVDEITTKLAEANRLFGNILEQLSKIK